MKTNNTIVGVAIAIAMLAQTPAGWATQCPGRITAVANDAADAELAVTLNPEHDCGCLYNRFVVPRTAEGRRAMHADVLTALVTGMRVSLGYDNDPATAPWCYLHDVSIIP